MAQKITQVFTRIRFTSNCTFNLKQMKLDSILTQVWVLFLESRSFNRRILNILSMFYYYLYFRITITTYSILMFDFFLLFILYIIYIYVLVCIHIYNYTHSYICIYCKGNVTCSGTDSGN